MKTIILQSENEADINLLIELANRLGVVCSFPSPEVAEQVQNEDELDVLFEGLGLEKEITYTSYAALSEDLPTDMLPNAQGLYEALQEVGGAWEDDEEETLEDLLNMLTP